MAHLELRKIWKRFGEEQALRGIEFECFDSEFLCLLGPSGAGKTTTIKVISGLEKPDEGEVRLDGELITDQLPQQRGMATAFESYALYPHLTVFDNLAFPLRAPVRAADLDEQGVAKRVRELAEMLAIDELLDRLPRQLSGGQRQRVALGRALIRRPKLYLLDEPIAHLDAKLRHRMRGELKRIQRELGVSTIYATPDQLEALSMADRIVVLNRGIVEQVGTPDEVYFEPTNVFVAAFVGDPPMNIYRAEITDGRLGLSGSAGFSIPVPGEDQRTLEEAEQGGQVLVGFRPVEIQLPRAESVAESERGPVVDIDTLGQSTIVGIQLGSLEVKAKVATASAPERGDMVGLDVGSARLYYFDPETQQRVGG
jgi:multiple sugar transport system ATP-binding protein